MDLAIELDRKGPQAQATLENAGESLLSLRELTHLLAAIEASGHHCAGCSHPSEAQPQDCGNCGRPSANRRQCHRCAHMMHLPRYLLQTNENDLALQTHCYCRGERHTTAR